MVTFEELSVSPELFAKQCRFLRAELDHTLTANPVDVLHDGTLLGTSFCFGILASDGRTFEVVGLVDVAVRREEVVLCVPNSGEDRQA